MEFDMLSSEENALFFTPIPEPQNAELSTRISVYRFRAKKTFSRTQLKDLINNSMIKDSEFGISFQWPQEDESLRSLWVKLGKKTITFINLDGEYRFYQLHRTLANSAVVEFFNDEDEIGLLIFGGSQNIHQELWPLLEYKIGVQQIDQQQLNTEDIRQMLHRYEGKIKKIQVDPSSDLMNWGGTRDAQLSSARGKHIDPESTVMQTIRDNPQIVVKGFKSFEEKIEVEGMQRAIDVYFEVEPNKVTIDLSKLEISDNQIHRAETIMYDLAKKVYSSVIREEKWITQKATPVSQQLALAFEFST